MSRQVQKNIEAAAAGGRTLVRVYAVLLAAMADDIKNVVQAHRARKAVLLIAEVDFKDRRQHQKHRHLRHPGADRRSGKRTADGSREL
ncbi:hypothetical protein ACERK3_11345 [Phycisphaerales bacterium AB-hyl4]|uniref:Uncharacterized protein n=1 Tax=Natronomicrosphaera hydrolytica TaxID=3242702 RepID=A0ABV4U7S6_9BACT